MNPPLVQLTHGPLALLFPSDPGHLLFSPAFLSQVSSTACCSSVREHRSPLTKALLEFYADRLEQRAKKIKKEKKENK